MDEPRHDEIRRVFELAIDLPATERPAVLDRECGGNQPLRRRVEAMLAAARDERFLSNPTANTGVDAPADGHASAAPGDRIGPYKLLQQIGEGGFGAVFMAEQERPVVRRVALKIIKLGMGTRQVVARFEAERQALAMMDHPNIAKVLDGGATETGRPYFVMELVRGDPITEYCDKNNLSTPERLALFVDVCHAVQHAHQKGIIHRDIKPSNVLVTISDGRPIPKVIDFGIAKATQGRLTEKTLFTEHRALIGTPEYMSPEQAEMSGVDIDTRSDIYSLGVLLYELLTGTTPFDARQLRSAAFNEIQRIIREEEPPRPSTRLSTMDTLPNVAAHRHTEPARLSRLVRGDLDWITMRCLEKDRTRRYETANGLAMDLQRHLAGEAVLAAPPSPGYRVRKFVHRHRGAVLAGSAVGLALILGVIGTSAGMVWARSEAASARLERDKSDRIAAFMEQLLSGAGPSVALGRDTEMLGEMMDAAATRLLKGDLADNPHAEIRLRSSIGSTYMELARLADAERLFTGALDLARKHMGDSDGLVRALTDLGALRAAHQARPADALPLFEEALRIQQKLHPGDHEMTARLHANLAFTLRFLGRTAEAQPLAKTAFEMDQRLYPGDHVSTAQTLDELAQEHQALQQFTEAESYYRQELAMRQRLEPGGSPLVALSMNNLAVLLRNLGRAADAAPLLEKCLDMRRQLFKPPHPAIATAMNNLGNAKLSLGDAGAAAKLFEQALEMRRALAPAGDANVARSLEDLAHARRYLGQTDTILTLLREALPIRERLDPAPSTAKAVTLFNLAEAYQALTQYDQAETHYRDSIAMSRAVHPDPWADTAITLRSYAGLLVARGDPVRAEHTYRESLAMFLAIFKGDHPDTVNAMLGLAKVLQQRGQANDADKMFRDAVAMQRGLAKGAPHPNLAATLAEYANFLDASGRFSEALPPRREVVDLYRQIWPDNPLAISGAQAQLATDLLKIAPPGCGPECEALLRDCLAKREMLFPDGDAQQWLRYNTMSLLGGALTLTAADPGTPADHQSAKLREAERLLLSAYDKLKDDPGVPPASATGTDRRVDALERVIHLYEVWASFEPGHGHDTQAESWRAKRTTTAHP